MRGKSQEQIRRLEQQLLGLGFLCWNDSGNHKRFAKRDRAGTVVESYGVNLMPAVALFESLRTFEAEQNAADLAYDLASNRMTRERRRCRGLLQHLRERGVTGIDALEAEASALIDSIRSGADRTLQHMQSVIEALADLIGRIVDLLDIRTHADSGVRGSKNVCQGTTPHRAHRVHPESNNQYSTDGRQVETDNRRTHQLEAEPGVEGAGGGRRGDPAQPPGPSDEETFIKLEEADLVGIVRGAVLPRLPARFSRRDMLAASETIRCDLGIGDSAWREAARAFGRWQASALVMMIAEKHRRGLVNHPVGYLQGCVRNKLDGSSDIWGMLIGLKNGRGGE